MRGADGREETRGRRDMRERRHGGGDTSGMETWGKRDMRGGDTGQEV